MSKRKSKLPKRRIATSSEIAEWAEKALVRRSGAGVPFYIPPTIFRDQTQLRTSIKRFYRVLHANGFIQPRQNGGTFIDGLAIKYGD